MSVDTNDRTREARWERVLRKSGSSTVVSLPPQLVSLAGLQKGDDVELITRLGEPGIKIEPATNDEQSESNADAE